MNDAAIRNFSAWARRDLLAGVRLRCTQYGILEQGSPAPDAQVIDGRVLSQQEQAQRAELLRMVAAQEDGWNRLVDRAAYTWFNRLVAIRYMEVNGRLPSHVRVLSAADGSFRPQAMDEALDLPLSLDAAQVARLMQEGNDEELFRLVFLAQCDELAVCMPAVFEPVGAAMELLLPDGLLRHDGVVEQLVTAIPEDDWREGVQIVGWMYQYYVAERKDEVFAGFKKGRKADRGSIAPATQLFTPNWIVRYLVQNSLGRLWVLNHPESGLPGSMEYFVRPDDDHETGFRRVASPEEITLADPACGSGHILAYAFDLLAQMYAEAGYTPREAARLIVEKNLAGVEIDPRAAALASFTLTMKACEYDGRFLRRGVTPRVTTLGRVELGAEELALCPHVAAHTALLDAAAHLDECGSLVMPTPDDLAAIDADLAALASGASLFAAQARTKLERLRTELEPLARAYDVVVANPPYMGSKNMGTWLGAWVKKHYPDVSRDLFSCFVVRNLSLGVDGAQLGFMTPYVWMFIGSYEKLRFFAAQENTITSLIQLEYSGFAGATVPICTFTLQKGSVPGYRGGYVRLSDFTGADNQAPKTREALANPDACPWFYRADPANFSAIPGTPIAYWASDAVLDAFRNFPSLSEVAAPRQGLATGDNNRFLRLWWEVPHGNIGFGMASRAEAQESGLRWFPCQKGGGYRRWYGLNEHVVNWEDDGREMREFSGSVIRNPNYYFREGMTWGTISSAALSMRFSPSGSIFETKGAMAFASSHESLLICLALTNTSLVSNLMSILAPTLDFHEGPMGKLPIATPDDSSKVDALTIQNIEISRTDWDSHETSWDFKRHPLV